MSRLWGRCASTCTSRRCWSRSDQYIDRTKSRTDTFFEDDGLVAHVSLADPTDYALSACLADAGEGAGARIHRGGTYVCMEGPQFSTRAESHLYRSWGAHVIGMTNLPEARLAREAELPYASLALVTDFDCWHEEEADVSVSHVVEVMHRNVAMARKVLTSIHDWPDPTQSPASSALCPGVDLGSQSCDPADQREAQPAGQSLSTAGDAVTRADSGP